MNGRRERWIKIVAAGLVFAMLVPVIALLIGTAVGDEGSIAPLVFDSLAAVIF